MPTFIGLNEINRIEPQPIIKNNLISFIDWGMLDKGAYANVELSNNACILRHESNPNYTDGTVWNGFRKNWVWESGTSQSFQPIQISGVYVDDILTTSGFEIDYPNGQVRFDTPISTDAVVKVEHSYKWITVIEGDEKDISRIEHESFQNNAPTSGTPLREAMTQLPAVIVEHYGGSTYGGPGMGGMRQTTQNYLLHFIGEDGGAVEKISNIIGMQSEMSILSYDPNWINLSGVYPLNYKGELNDGALTYPQWVEAYPWRKLTFSSNIEQKTNKINSKFFHKPMKVEISAVLGII